VLSEEFAQMRDLQGKSGEKGLKLKEAEFCSNVPWLFQVET
jgi:hypothetical protein